MLEHQLWLVTNTAAKYPVVRQTSLLHPYKPASRTRLQVLRTSVDRRLNDAAANLSNNYSE